jgi:hypothetical protein
MWEWGATRMQVLQQPTSRSADGRDHSEAHRNELRFWRDYQNNLGRLGRLVRLVRLVRKIRKSTGRAQKRGVSLFCTGLLTALLEPMAANRCHRSRGGCAPSQPPGAMSLERGRRRQNTARISVPTGMVRCTTAMAAWQGIFACRLKPRSRSRRTRGQATILFGDHTTIATNQRAVARAGTAMAVATA